MNDKNLPFKIGEQYENWEFDLDCCSQDRIKGLDSYIYIRDLIFLGVKVNYVELIFSLDILQAVMLILQFDSLKELTQFEDVLIIKIGIDSHFEKESLGLANFELTQGLRLAIKQITNENTITIIYGLASSMESLIE